MSLASAINAAVSGLDVTARRAETVSNNVANATTDGYARRSLIIVPAGTSPGARVVGTERHIDTIILGDARLAAADSAGSDLLARQYLRIETAIGPAGSQDSLGSAIDRLDAALISAAGRPSDDSRLAEVSDAISALAARFARASEAVQSVRAQADREIAADVAALNSGLSGIAALDRQIVQSQSTGRETASLQDQRQKILDGLSGIVPLREQALGDGRSRIVTANGAILLDGHPAKLDFAPTATFGATGPQPGGLLVNGQPVRMGDGGSLSGGTLSAAFQLRDNAAPAVQKGLDDLAALSMTRLASSDPTLAPGGPGLLTDRGNALDPSRIAGLSARLELNLRADLDQGGDLWRIRSGLGAVQPLPSGESTVLAALATGFSRFPDSPANGFASLLDQIAQKRVAAENTSTTAKVRAQALTTALAEGAVNTDAEMQDLLQIEKAYAANARVLQTVDEMLAYLLAR